MSLTRSRTSILLIIVLYLFIYNPIPRWPGVGFGLFLTILAFIYSLVRFDVYKRYTRYYSEELKLSLFMIPYVLVIILLNGESDIHVVPELVSWILFSTCIPVFLIRVLIVKQKGFIFWDAILLVGFIASLFSCVALFVPSFNEFLRAIQLKLEGGETENQLDFRFYGLAINLSSGYGYVQGLLASLSLLLLDRRHLRYAVYFITLTLSVLVNARTGIFPIVITVIYLIGKSIVKFKIGQFIKVLIGSIAAIYLVVLIINLLPNVKEFIDDFFDQLFMMFLAEDSNLGNSAYVDRFKLPGTIGGLIFGEGYSLYGLDNKWEASDIGFVNQIFTGGLVFAGSLLVYEIIVYMKIMKRSKEYVFSTIFFLSMLVFNYKGMNFYAGGAYIKLYMLYYFVLVHNQISVKNKIAIT